MPSRILRIGFILIVFTIIIPFVGARAWSNLIVFSISGHVTTITGEPVSGVTINLTGYQASVTQTNGAGTYSFNSLTPNGNYTVRPSKENFYFTPRSRIYNSLSQNEIADFVAKACTYSLSSSGQSFAAAGGTGKVSLSANDAFCSWTAVSNVPWMRITSSSNGNGNSLIRFAVDPSTNTRSGTLTIGGLSFTVNQSGCTYALTPSQQSFPATGGTGSINVSALESFCPWTATSNVPWISMTSGSGMGNGIATYTVSPTTQSRRGIVTVAGHTFAVYQAAVDACQSLAFAPGSVNAVGIRPINMIVDDFNADGRDDLVTSNYTDIAGQPSSYSVLLSNGDGTFIRSTINLTGIGLPWGVAAGNFNSDDKPDLVISGSSGRIVILLNNGTGTFTQANGFDLDTIGGLVAADDFDRDGKDDFAVVSRNDDELRIMRGNGGGTFTALGPLYVLVGRAYTLTKGDFNGDGFTDLAVISEEPFGVGRLHYLLGNGAGAFGAPVTTALPIAFPYGLQAGDFNGDGRDDLAITGLSISQIAVLLWNKETNGFAAPVNYLTDQTAAGRLAVGDVNGDGKVDIVGAGSGGFTSNKIDVLLGNGDGTFVPAAYFTLTFGTSHAIVLGKFNGDGKLDFAISTDQFNDPGLVVIGLNTCTRVDTTATPFDFDGDGKSDVSVFRPSTGFWYISQSSNTVFRATQFGQSGDQIVPGDYDGDGKTDVAVFRPSITSWYSLDSSTGASRATPFGQAGDVPAVGDFDGDGKSDIALYRPSAGTFYLIYSSDNSFHFQQWGTNGDLPVIGDYDGDSRSDFAIFRPSSGSFHVLRSSDGATTELQWGASGDKPIAADFDGDGKTDICVYRPSGGGWYYVQSSDNAFKGVAWGASGDIPVAGEFDGDGKWDVAVFRPSNGEFYILQSTNSSLMAEQFGTNGDVPVPSAYVP